MSSTYIIESDVAKTFRNKEKGSHSYSLTLINWIISEYLFYTHEMRRVEDIMDEYASMVRQQRKWMLYLLIIYVLGTVFTPYTPVFLGLLVGGIASFLGLVLLHRNVNKLGEKVAEKGTYRGGLGTLSRLLLAGLAVLIA